MHPEDDEDVGDGESGESKDDFTANGGVRFTSFEITTRVEANFGSNSMPTGK